MTIEPRKISPRQRAFLSEVRALADEMKNKGFGDLYYHSVSQKLLHGDDSYMKFMAGLDREPVDIEEFLDSKEFLGATDLNIWPEVRNAVIEMNRHWWKNGFGAYNQAVLMGACVDDQTEFLTPDGWKFITDYKEGDTVGQYHDNGLLDFVRPREYIKQPATDFLHFNPRGGLDMMLTPGHRVIYRNKNTGKIQEMPAEDVASTHNRNVNGFTGKFISTFMRIDTVGIPLTDEQIRVMVMVHADGSFYSSNSHRCNIIVKKWRKICRVKKLLQDAGILYEEREHDNGEYLRFVFIAPEHNKHYDEWWDATKEQLEIIVDEVMHWDGSELHDQYYTSKKEEADFIQYAMLATGVRATMQWQDRGGNRSREYRVKRCKSIEYSMDSPTPRQVEMVKASDGFAYCFSLPTKMWLARRNGKVFVTGNTSTAKSTIATINTQYALYLLSCLKVPQNIYGLPKTTSIVFAIMAAKPNVMKKVVYMPMRKQIEAMPYFQKYMLPSKLIESEMYFEEKNIRIVPAGGDEDAILGEAVIGGIIDEINFMNVVLRSKKAEVTSGRAGVYDRAQQVHTTMVRRKQGRFITQGPSIGMVISSSSTRYKGDYTDKLKDQVTKGQLKAAYIYNRRQYDVWPQDRYSGRTFRLLIANDMQHDTRVLKDDEPTPVGAWIENVPIEYIEVFSTNPYDALRDVMGISNNSLSPFIKSRFKIYECVEAGKEAGLESFLVKDHVILGIDGMPQVKTGTYCLNPSRPRYVHIDLSRNADRCGIAMVRFDGMKTVQRANGVAELMPTCAVEMALTIAPDAQNEIDVAEIRAFVRHLKVKYGYPIRSVSYDGVDSRESIQQWRKDGMRATMVSVDRSTAPYKQFRDAMYDTRVLLPDNDILIEEILTLEHDETKDKIDHPVHFTKDCADAACGAYTNMLERKATWSAAASDDAAHDMANRASDDERFDEARS